MTVAVIVADEQDVGKFGRYLAEILRAEGLADLEIIGLRSPRLHDLTEFAAVVVARSRPSKVQTARLRAFAEGGGRLVLVRPSYYLARALGLRSASTMVAPAYVRPSDTSPIASGLPQEPIETHLPADAYAPEALPADALTVARLYADIGTATSFPAIVELPFGDGHVVVFTYDLAQAVSLIRQGDPDRVGGRGLGAGEPYRIQDLLTGYADSGCWHLPQADLHAAMLVNAVNQMATFPQARMWYYPEPVHRSVLVLDSDDDWSASEHFDTLLGAVDAHGGKITVYLMSGTSRGTVASPEKVAEWRARGHSFGVHHDPSDPSFGGEDPEEVILDLVRKDLADFDRHYGGGVPTTNRNHCLAWKGYVDLPKLYAELGVRMDLNSVGAGPSWLQYLTGSARPVRFVDADGTVVNCFQQSTQAYDDLAVKGLLSADPRGQAHLTRKLMEDKVTRYFSPLSMLSHPVSFFTYSRAYMELCWQAASELRMPIWSAFEWADFVVARDQARISAATCTDGVLRYRVTGKSPTGSLTILLPVASDRVSRATVDTEVVPVTGIDVFGWSCSLIPISVEHDRASPHEITVETC
ncbi:hypothetical protein SAMN05421678_10626 [Actinopolymorpha cephalotaxi]|uniref:Polysaccharide deacetylase n=1 Tax=Actinopolymorpha cephalotaxi TaxID=504797 RepID=A0A1I2RXE8_9ACTN|nr:hypothetical protein [Actinopolymorpha cephalotaxi]NYH83824.1 hypothetical protein [Actinopolymorpha cephalotaxi]SFG45150.1 hypothetical protein SAMN05421678_10626 [Actinopolymorpha cephalotaxi]